ncbi:MAG: DUF4156 domain-containing protein [Gammaproteobacteria bacterium]|nr:DUF4156 domain-containing protein [Gammaproteobacteria bacterium]
MYRNIILLSALATLAGCASLELNEGGEKVRVLDPSEIETCRELGRTNTTTTAKVMGIDRPIETIAKELRIVARNSASNMGGDTIVPLTVIEEGAQTFMVYKCVNPDG